MAASVSGLMVGGESFLIFHPFFFSAEFWLIAFLLPASWIGELMAVMMRELMVLAWASLYWSLVVLLDIYLVVWDPR
jgi:hypothetical protein